MAKFKRGIDPKKSMGLGYGGKLNTKGWKVLEFIRDHGGEGVSLTDIQKFIFVNLNGNSEEDFWASSPENYEPTYAQRGARNTRGYWTDYLYGKRTDYLWQTNRFSKRKWPIE